MCISEIQKSQKTYFVIFLVMYLAVKSNQRLTYLAEKADLNWCEAIYSLHLFHLRIFMFHFRNINALKYGGVMFYMVYVLYYLLKSEKFWFPKYI